MDNRKAVHLKKTKVTRYAYQRLHYCTLCGRYTALDVDVCPGCGNRKKGTHIDKVFDINIKRRFQTDHLILLTLLFIGLIFAKNLSEILIMLIAGAVLHVLLFLLQRLFRTSERAYLMDLFFTKYYGHIFNGLKFDADDAGNKMKQENFKEAYEDLREVSCLLNNDSIKLSKLICLSNFILRKDMELELDTLIPSTYKPLFINYLNEAVKLNRGLVKGSVIDYVITHEESILNGGIGMEVLGNVAGAAIRSKKNIIRYRDFIQRYIKAMKKDRLLRLYKLLESGREEKLEGLYREVVDVVNGSYVDDSDFNMPV